MANQTLQKEDKKGKTKQVTARLIVPDGFTPYKFAVDHSKPFTAECLRVDGATVMTYARGDIHARIEGDVRARIEHIEHKPVSKVKKKITGFAEKINPFAGKPYVAPKAIQDKIEDVKQLLKGSPIPKEFLK